MYSSIIAYLLFFVGGFGTLGFHRFYLGKVGTGLLYLFTGGLFGIGCVYDFFTLPMQVRESNLEARYRNALNQGPVRPSRARYVGSAPEAKKESVERVILRTARKNSGIATPSEVALEADIPIETAKKQLEQLVSKGYADVRVTKSGTLVYVFRDFVTDESEARLEDF